MPVPRAEKRLVAVLLADVAGSTGIAEALGSERSKFLFDELIRLIAAEVERYGGTVAQLLGDGVLALFGAPTAHDDDAERAVRAALGVQGAVAGYATEVGDAYGLELAVRVAVEMGSVVVGAESTDAGDRFNALGDPVNVAARLQELGRPGEVVAGPEAARSVASAFALESLGEVELRGRTQPVEAFRICAGVPEAPARRLSALVGRDFERTLLTRAVEELADGLGVVLAVTGEPGIGKTRLLTEAVNAAGGGVAVLEGHCTSYAGSFPLWPLRDLIRSWLDLPVTAAAAQLRLELRARLASLYPEPGERYAMLAQVLGVSPGDEQAAHELSQENVQQRIAETLAELIATLSVKQPLLVVLDDLHWADPATLAVLQRLLDATEQASVGIALVYRSERDSGAWALAERARQRFPHRFREVELRALAPDAAARLAAEAAGGELPEAIAARVVERAGGNPFFVEEAIRDLSDRGVLDAAGGLAAGVDAGSVVIPGAIRSALQARLDRLPAQGREVVSVAAVAGRRFSIDLLEQVLPPDTAHAGLVELLRAELVVERRRRPAAEYVFRHGLVQEVAYAGLLDTDRRAIHLRVADALERRDMPPAPMLAHHLAEADVPDRAATALIAAGDQARSIWATDEAVNHYRRAREFLARLGDDDRSRDTLAKIALVHHLDFEFERAEAAYDEAFCCRRPQAAAPVQSATLRTAVWCPDEIAPGFVITHEAAAVTDLFFRGLLRTDRELNVLPDLAENFRVSADGRSYLFQLREHLQWSDGVPLTSHDFAHAWRSVREASLPTAFLLDDIERFVVHDDHTIEVVVTEPRNYFPYILTLPCARPWPRHVSERHGLDWRTRELVTCGPYRIESIDSGGLVAEADPLWTGSAGNVSRIELAYLSDRPESRDHRMAAWRANEFDVLAGEFSPTDAGDVATVATTVPSLGATMLSLRPSSPGLAAVEVRQAIASAIDTGEISPTIGHAARTAQPAGLLPPAMPGHSTHSGMPHDPRRAAALLEAAGHPGGAGLPRFRLSVKTSAQEGARTLARQLAAVGIETELVEDVAGADMGLTSWIADYPDPDGFFRGLAHGMSHCPIDADPRAERMLEAARQVRDHDARLEQYRAIDRHFAREHATLLPIAYIRSSILRRPWVSGVWASPMVSMRLADAVVGERPADTEPMSAMSSAT